MMRNQFKNYSPTGSGVSIEEGALRVKLIAPLSAAKLLTLQEMPRHHIFDDCRFRARGFIALNDHLQPKVIATVLGMA
jgi:hypothetical protein